MPRVDGSTSILKEQWPLRSTARILGSGWGRPGERFSYCLSSLTLSLSLALLISPLSPFPFPSPSLHFSPSYHVQLLSSPSTSLPLLPPPPLSLPLPPSSRPFSKMLIPCESLLSLWRFCQRLPRVVQGSSHRMTMATANGTRVFSLWLSARGGVGWGRDMLRLGIRDVGRSVGKVFRADEAATPEEQEKETINDD